VRASISLPVLLACLLAPVAQAGTVYKTIDKDGNVVFTDQPLEGAEQLGSQSRPSESFSDDEGQSDDQGPGEQNGPEDEFPSLGKGVALTPDPKNPPKQKYKAVEEPNERPLVTRVEILTPFNNAILQDPLGPIWVELQSYPTPIKKSGLTAQLWMDDQLIATGKRPMLSLPPPERGTHSLQVRMVDEKGRLFIVSEKINVHIKYRVAGQGSD